MREIDRFEGPVHWGEELLPRRHIIYSFSQNRVGGSGKETRFSSSEKFDKRNASDVIDTLTRLACLQTYEKVSSDYLHILHDLSIKLLRRKGDRDIKKTDRKDKDLDPTQRVDNWATEIGVNELFLRKILVTFNRAWGEKRNDNPFHYHRDRLHPSNIHSKQTWYCTTIAQEMIGWFLLARGERGEVGEKKKAGKLVMEADRKWYGVGRAIQEVDSWPTGPRLDEIVYHRLKQRKGSIPFSRKAIGRERNRWYNQYKHEGDFPRGTLKKFGGNPQAQETWHPKAQKLFWRHIVEVQKEVEKRQQMKEKERVLDTRFYRPEKKIGVLSGKSAPERNRERNIVAGKKRIRGWRNKIIYQLDGDSKATRPDCILKRLVLEVDLRDGLTDWNRHHLTERIINRRRKYSSTKYSRLLKKVDIVWEKTRRKGMSLIKFQSEMGLSRDHELASDLYEMKIAEELSGTRLMFVTGSYLL